MKLFTPRALLTILPLISVACATPGGSTSEGADSGLRDSLFDAVSTLDGDWVLLDEQGGNAGWEFKLSSNGTVVRETMMRGTEHEMTNIYTRDGDGLAMVHYCAGGNQPRMRATSFDGEELSFAFHEVYDIESREATFMGEMTLVFVDANTIEQRWHGLRLDGKDAGHDTVMRLTRR